jgi:hypothetical protein
MNFFDPQKSSGAGSRLSRPTAASLAKVSVSPLFSVHASFYCFQRSNHSGSSSESCPKIRSRKKQCSGSGSTREQATSLEKS